MNGHITSLPIALSDSTWQYVARRVEEGHYGSVDEYLCDLIRNDQLEQERARLRAMVQEGLNSGPGRADTAEDLAEMAAVAKGAIP